MADEDARSMTLPAPHRVALRGAHLCSDVYHRHGHRAHPTSAQVSGPFEKTAHSPRPLNSFARRGGQHRSHVSVRRTKPKLSL
jgi:hypothetical protein